jgi:hypothetical protein
MARRVAEGAAQAEFERAVGPIRDFGFFDEGCDKCGHKEHGLAICLGKNMLAPRERDCCFIGEHLHAICARCGDVWIERCKNDPENGQGERPGR